MHPDRLGSPEAITGDGGALVERRSFDVWGTPSKPSSNTLLAFTGHTDDIGIATGGTAFIDMGGRIYSPLLKHFWSPDPYVQAPLYGPSWNRFAYTLGNPLKFTDPTGYAWNNTSSLFGYGSGGLVGQGIISLVDEYHEQMAYEGDWAVKVHVMHDGREVATFMTPRVNLARAVADDRQQRRGEGAVLESRRRVLEKLCRDEDCSTWQPASPKTSSASDARFLMAEPTADAIDAFRRNSIVLNLSNDNQLPAGLIGLPGWDILMIHGNIDGSVSQGGWYNLINPFDNHGPKWTADEARKAGLGTRPIIYVVCWGASAQGVADEIQQPVLAAPIPKVWMFLHLGPIRGAWGLGSNLFSDKRVRIYFPHPKEH